MAKPKPNKMHHQDKFSKKNIHAARLTSSKVSWSDPGSSKPF